MVVQVVVDAVVVLVVLVVVVGLKCVVVVEEGRGKNRNVVVDHCFTLAALVGGGGSPD